MNNKAMVLTKLHGLTALVLFALILSASILGPAKAQGVIGKNRVVAIVELVKLADVSEGGVRSGSCLRPIGEIGTEEFSVYLLLPVLRIEGFVVELSGDDGDASEVIANAGIASFTENGNTIIRGNLGFGWVAEAYRVAANHIRSTELHLDASYEEALARVPTERCPRPYSQRIAPQRR